MTSRSSASGGARWMLFVRAGCVLSGSSSARPPLPVRGRYMPTATMTTRSTARKTYNMATFLDLDSDEFVYDDRAHDHADQARDRQHQPGTRREQRAHVGRRNQHQQ